MASMHAAQWAAAAHGDPPQAADGPSAKVERFSDPSVAGVPDKTTTVWTTKTQYADGTTKTVIETRTEAGPKTTGTRKTQIHLGSLGGGPALSLIFLIWVQVLLVTLVYGPVAAFLAAFMEPGLLQRP